MVEKTFIIVSVESALNGVFIYLRPSEPVVVPSTSLERVLATPPQTEDEKMAKQVVQTIMQEMKKALPMDVMPAAHSPFIVRVYLTQSEYEELHKPTVGDTIQMQLQTQKEGESIARKSGET